MDSDITKRMGDSVGRAYIVGAGETPYIVGAEAGGSGKPLPYNIGVSDVGRTIGDHTTRELINTIAGIEISGFGTEGSIGDDIGGRLYGMSEDATGRLLL